MTIDILDEIKVTRFISAFFSILHTIIIGILNPLAAFFMATSSWQIKYSSEAMLDSQATFFATLAILFFVKAKGNWNKYIVFSAIALGMACASKYIVMTTVLTILPFLIWQFRKQIRLLFFYLFIVLGVFYICDPIIWLHPVKMLKQSIEFHILYSQGSAVQAANFPFYQQLVWLYNQVPFQSEIYYFNFDRIILILGLIGLPVLFKRKPVFRVWLLVNLVFLLGYPTKWPQYTLILIPALSISVGEFIYFAIFKLNSHLLKFDAYAKTVAKFNLS